VGDVFTRLGGQVVQALDHAAGHPDEIKNSNSNPFKVYHRVVSTVGHAIDEIPLPDTVRAAITAPLKLVDASVGQIESTTGLAFDLGVDVWNDSKAVGQMVGLGVKHGELSIDDVKKVSRRLKDNYGIPAPEALRGAHRLVRKVKVDANALVSGIQGDHYELLENLYDSTKHHLTRNALYEGGQHTFPPHGNTLVGHTRSVLDSSLGSRSVYEPYLPFNVKDKLASGAMGHKKYSRKILDQFTSLVESGL
jgi:hypothetical protein